MHIDQKFDLSGKVALVTGASKGIGKSIAQALGQKGAKVVISSRKQEALDEVAKEFSSEGIDVLAVAANIGDAQSMIDLVSKTNSHFGGVDILVNNAAANPSFGPVQNTDANVFDKIMNVNVKGPFELAKLMYPIMKERGGGSIINISSIGGLSPETMLGIYSVSKAAIISLTKVLGKEWGRVGIRANVICPGLIQTKFSEALWSNEDIMNSVMKELPAQRIGQPEEIASLALFLAADAGSYCTGAVFTADGGYTI
ncbi:MAG: glucose 1-dehydrogenase [Cyclobacteriaceae bacterium]|nr:glucose 1-dehydrogenase [Cyclobacteriaceae bacterium]